MSTEVQPKFKAAVYINKSTMDKTDVVSIEAQGDTKDETLALFKALKKEATP